MNKDPAFLFYPNDYLGGTMGFTLEQHGAYTLLLIYQFNNGPFTAENAASIVGSTVFESIRQKFQPDNNGFLYNARLMQEMDKRKKHSEHQKENANKRWKKDAMAMRPHCDGIAMAMPLENENENRNSISSVSSEEGVQREKQKQVYSPEFEEFWSDYPRKVGKGKAFLNWKKAIANTEPAIIIAGAKRYAVECKAKGTEESYIKHPEGWLTARRWEDQPAQMSVFQSQQKQPAHPSHKLYVPPKREEEDDF